MTPPPEIVLVVAVADNGVIGHRGGMPWHAPEDLRRFRRITMGRPVVMGRRTFESIGKPLPGRRNIVLTRNAGWSAPGVTNVGSVAEAVEAAGDPAGIMVIGGADVFAQWLPVATRAEITRLHVSPPGDTFWKPLDDGWELVASETPAGTTPSMTFESWRRGPAEAG